MNYTFENFPKWLKKSELYIKLLENITDLTEELPLSGHLYETDEIEIDYWKTDFKAIFNSKNEWQLYDYPISIYLFALIKKEEVVKILEKINNPYSKLFLKDIDSYPLKYKNHICSYAELNYDNKFLEEYPILEKLKKTPIYDIKYNCKKEDVVKYLVNKKNKTYERVQINTIRLEFEIFRDGILEEIIDDSKSDCKVIKVKPSMTICEDTFHIYPDFCSEEIDYENINLSKGNIDTELNLFTSLDDLEEIIKNPNYDKKSVLTPFQFIDDKLIIDFQFNENNYIHILHINEFNVDKFIKDLKNFNYSDNIEVCEILENETMKSLFIFRTFYNDYKPEKQNREIKNIYFNLKY